MKSELSRKLSSEEAAQRIGTSVQHLAKMRLSGEGPPFFKIGARKLVYSEADVLAWLKARRATRTPGNGPGGRPRKSPVVEPAEG